MSERDPNLTCYGCCHSVSGEPFPGRPSGERPCHFCIRNMDLDLSIIQKWYDGSEPVGIPMDCYHSVDMLRQIDAWNRGRQTSPA